MSDVVRARNKRGVMVYKAESPRGRKVLGMFMGGPWQMAEEVFVNVPDENEGAILQYVAQEACEFRDWEPPKPKPVDVSQLTEF